MKAKHAIKFCSYCQRKFSITINTDSSFFGWGACTENGRTRDHFSLEERELCINILELKAALYGLILL